MKYLTHSFQMPALAFVWIVFRFFLFGYTCVLEHVSHLCSTMTGCHLMRLLYAYDSIQCTKFWMSRNSRTERSGVMKTFWISGQWNTELNEQKVQNKITLVRWFNRWAVCFKSRAFIHIYSNTIFSFESACFVRLYDADFIHAWI